MKRQISEAASVHGRAVKPVSSKVKAKKVDVKKGTKTPRKQKSTSGNQDLATIDKGDVIDQLLENDGRKSVSANDVVKGITKDVAMKDDDFHSANESSEDLHADKGKECNFISILFFHFNYFGMRDEIL